MTAAAASGQTLGDLRNELSESLRQAKFASSLGALVLLAEEVELAGASYDVDSSGGTELSSYVLPFATRLKPFSDERLGLYLEGVLGFTQASESIGDLYEGEFPQIATAVDAEWRSYSAFGGIGPSWTFRDDLTATAILSFGVAKLENDSDYAGPGADATAAVLDGLAFNWEAWTLSYGGALRLDWVHELGERRSVRLVGRYDSRWTTVVESDDPAQDFTSRIQLATLRAEVRSPTGWSAGAMPVDYRLRVGARRLTEGDIFGAQQLFEAGGTLELLTGETLPVATGVQLTGTMYFGDDISGWALGVGLSF